ncbi:MAG: glutamyl-tRNA reductase [Actinomycetota bacterium]
MSVVVVGLNHKTAPVSLLERLAINEERLPKALHQLATAEHVVEGAILSTCNRTEVYAVVSKYHAGAQDIRNFLAEFCHVEPEDFIDHLYTYHDDSAVRHLFRVAAGIDSMVVGESEILGQVRRSYLRADDEGLISRILGAAFRQALRVGKRARSETEIGRNPVSVSSAAVDLARRAFPATGLTGKRVAIVGAGKMGRLAARALADAGATELTVVNRTAERAENLAEIFDATAVPFELLEDTIADSDILICSTTAPETIVDASMLQRAMQPRGEDRPLFIVDIAVPRDVDPGAAEITGVVLRDIDDLKGVVEANLGSRMGEVTRVEELITTEVDRFLQWERSTEFAPTAASLVSKIDLLREVELQRIAAQLESMTPEQRDAVDHLTRRLVSKILHTPLAKSRDAASSKQGYLYLTVLRELFELDDERDEDDL